MHARNTQSTEHLKQARIPSKLNMLIEVPAAAPTVTTAASLDRPTVACPGKFASRTPARIPMRPTHVFGKILTNRAWTVAANVFVTFDRWFVLPVKVAPPSTSAKVAPSVLTWTVNAVTYWFESPRPCVTTPRMAVAEPRSIIIQSPTVPVPDVNQPPPLTAANVGPRLDLAYAAPGATLPFVLLYDRWLSGGLSARCNPIPSSPVQSTVVIEVHVFVLHV